MILYDTSSGHSEVCRYCGFEQCRDDYDLIWKDERFGRYTVQSCPKCGIAFVDPFPTPSELEALYNSIEYHSDDRNAGNFWEMDSDEIARRVLSEQAFISKYSKYLPSTGAVLDIGVGWGTLLKLFEEQGWRSSGIELSETEVEFATHRFKLDVHKLAIEDLNQLPVEGFDLVTMRHVLEHFADPVTALKTVRKKLRTSGRLIVEVPDYGSWDRGAYGDKWPAFGPYLWYFSRQSLNRLLGDCGFRILAFNNFLSDLVFSKPNYPHRTLRRMANRIGMKRFFSGRSIGLIATPTYEKQ